jgi:hypothetical protein
MPIATCRETHRSEGGKLQKAITDPVDGTFVAELSVAGAYQRLEFASAIGTCATWISSQVACESGA